MVGNKNQFGLTVDESCVGGGKTENVANRRKTAETEKGEASSTGTKTPRRSTSRNGAALN
jgi:hypothetical protein